jgi:hypothetical protein
MQWLKSVETIQEKLVAIPSSQVIEIRYEVLLAQPHRVMKEICDFIGARNCMGQDATSILMPRNSGRWQAVWSRDEVERVGALIGNKLIELDYEVDHSWYRH